MSQALAEPFTTDGCVATGPSPPANVKHQANIATAEIINTASLVYMRPRILGIGIIRKMLVAILSKAYCQLILYDWLGGRRSNAYQYMKNPIKPPESNAEPLPMMLGRSAMPGKIECSMTLG
jgi:hypothetical protein